MATNLKRAFQYQALIYILVKELSPMITSLKVTRKTGLGSLVRYIIRACFSQANFLAIP